MAGPCFHIGLNARRSNLDRWGEHGYALSLCKALNARGCQARIFCRDEQPQLAGAGDVILWICGPHVSEPIAGAANFLWMISPPNLVSLGLLRRLQGVFIASQGLTDFYRSKGIKAQYVAQATDPEFFHPGRGAGEERFDVTFVGNLAYRVARPNVFHAIEMGFDVKLWGAGWKDVVPPQNYGGPRLSAEELADVYARSNVVLNSHMAPMIRFGMMSNRSYDALASGARVISDALVGYEAADLPDLIQASGPERLRTALNRAQEQGPASKAQREAIAASVRQKYSFDGRAAFFIAQAEAALAAGLCAPPAMTRLTRAVAKTQVQKRVLRDLAPENAENLAQDLDAQMMTSQLDVTLELTDPAEAGQGTQHQAMLQSAQAVLRLGVIHARCRGFARIRITQPPRAAKASPFHPGMFDLRRAQALVAGDGNTTEMDALCTRARRVVEVLSDETHPLRLAGVSDQNAQMLVRVINDRPLYAHSPANYSKETQKQHVALWSRKNPVRFERPVGVLLHLYYTDLAGIFYDRLARLPLPYRLYISTDTEAKAREIAGVFPQAEIRVLPNRGRDVFPKLYGFSDVFARHDLTLHLHGKKSNHSAKLDSWLDLILDCLLPQTPELNRLLSFFSNIPKLGLVVPLTHQSVIGAGHWGDNLELAQEAMARIGCEINRNERDMPDTFPVGGMFWARSAALRPLLDMNLTAEHFPPEAGQLDATIAHAIERLYGVVCRQAGYQVLRVASSDNHSYRAFRQKYRSNGALRDALETMTIEQEKGAGNKDVEKL